MNKLNLIKNKSVSITKEEETQIMNFVNESVGTHLSQGRTIELVRSNITIGKLGEMGFHKLCKENDIPITDIKLENKKYGDGGFDFIVEEDKRTDVKTLDQNWKKRVYLGTTVKNDMWTLIMLNDLNAVYIGSLERKDIRVCDLRYDDKQRVYLDKELFEKSTY